MGHKNEKADAVHVSDAFETFLNNSNFGIISRICCSVNEHSQGGLNGYKASFDKRADFEAHEANCVRLPIVQRE